MSQLRNTKHEIFCDAFVRCARPRRAAITAGYAPTSASSQAYRLRQRPDIRNRIGELEQMTPWARKLLHQQIIVELGLYAFGGMGKVFTKTGSGKCLININTITPKDFTGMDVSLKVGRAKGSTKITLRAKMTGKSRALKALMPLCPPNLALGTFGFQGPSEIRLVGVLPDHGE